MTNLDLRGFPWRLIVDLLSHDGAAAARCLIVSGAFVSSADWLWRP